MQIRTLQGHEYGLAVHRKRKLVVDAVCKSNQVAIYRRKDEKLALGQPCKLKQEHPL